MTNEEVEKKVQGFKCFMVTTMLMFIILFLFVLIEDAIILNWFNQVYQFSQNVKSKGLYLPSDLEINGKLIVHGDIEIKDQRANLPGEYSIKGNTETTSTSIYWDPQIAQMAQMKSN